jgi:prophage regulatory protein
MEPTNDRLIRLPEVMVRTGLSRSAVYDRLRAGSPRHDPSFPRPVTLGQRTVAFSEQELNGWMAARLAARKPKAA